MISQPPFFQHLIQYSTKYKIRTILDQNTKFCSLIKNISKESIQPSTSVYVGQLERKKMRIVF